MVITNQPPLDNMWTLKSMFLKEYIPSYGETRMEKENLRENQKEQKQEEKEEDKEK